jgi:peroxiredoxin-like protein
MARFSVSGTWKGDRNGTGKITSEQGLNLEVSAPKELDGPGIGSSPEELLISASNNCYMITLAAMLSNRKIDVDKLEVVSEGVVETIDGRLHFKEILHNPVISLSKDSGVTEEKLTEIAIRAEKACFISQTLRNNVEFIVKPTIIIGA